LAEEKEPKLLPPDTYFGLKNIRQIAQLNILGRRKRTKIVATRHVFWAQKQRAMAGNANDRGFILFKMDQTWSFTSHENY